ncbi:methyltransferase domain-containing protein [candidate division KSB1 bacterium]|nr:methyltransferase domain-containing protein [candidate division KSB1 bacterium]
MKLWSVWAPLYRYLRRPWPLSAILRQEDEALLELLPTFAKHACIVDLGCGSGHIGQLLSASAPIIGIDASLAMLNTLSDTLYDPINANARCLPLKTQSVDLVLAIGLCEYLDSLSLFFESLARVMKPGGVAVVSTSPENIYTHMRRVMGHRIYVHSKRDFGDALEPAGLRCLREKELFSQHLFVLQKRG